MTTDAATPTPSSASVQEMPPPLPSRFRFTLDWKWTLAICAALLVLFGTLSFTASLTKSATYDEPLHVMGGFVHRWFKDYRINFEDPALFGMWAAAPLGDTAIAMDIRHPAWEGVKTNTDMQWVFTIYTLYRAAENWPDSTLAVCRSQFMFIGVALGALAAWWSWKLAGAIGAITATFLFALDPNLTAHASIVKNDVATGLLLLGLAYSMWQFGRHGSIWRFAIVAFVCGAAANTKFSGVLFGPIALLLLIARAVLAGREPWRIAGMRLKNIWDRLAAVTVMIVVIGFVVWGMTWAVYGFRFAPMRDGSQFNMEFRMQFARAKELTAQITKREKIPRPPTQAEFDKHKGGIVPRFAMWLNDVHLLPQGWLFGFLYTYATTQIRSSFLLNESSIIGWVKYFPLTMLFKTPLATLLAMVGALGLALTRVFSPRFFAGDWSSHAPSPDRAIAPRLDLWTILCLLVPPLVYGLVAMMSNLNLGLRHILPVYPFIFIGIAVMTTVAVKLVPKWSRFVVPGLALLLAIESLPTWPNYIPFFNAPSRLYGRLNLLADSNLDWGQDLKALGEWYQKHNDRPLYLCYFGTVDPSFYNIKYTNLSGGWLMAPQVPLSSIKEPGYVAISATNLQGVYLQKDDYAEFRKIKPRQIINGTIYIFDWPTK